MENKEFSYNYSAKEQEEILKIKEKYTKKDEVQNNLEKIKELDKKPGKSATTAALFVGIISSLIMGSGMSLVMIASDFVLGILVGCIGLVGMILTYPVYRWIYKIVKNEVKDEILELCDKEIIK